jgi:hypothetical protein
MAVARTNSVESKKCVVIVVSLAGKKKKKIHKANVKRDLKKDGISIAMERTGRSRLKR